MIDASQTLAPESSLDREIGRLQAKIRENPRDNPLLERLGWAFVAKARLSSDPGFYTLAEQAALLLGHVYDAMHRFAEAEQIARGLTARREFVFDYALLGDALMEQGKLGEAAPPLARMPKRSSSSTRRIRSNRCCSLRSGRHLAFRPPRSSALLHKFRSTNNHHDNPGS